MENKTNKLFYNAMLSRDSRFDGKFFAAVKTTKIYCRSICPAPKPKFENVVFYKTSTEAELNGFRPCLRCNPESSPGSPIWGGTSSTVSRALKLIDSGFLIENSVKNLSDVLGLSDSQIRKLFKKHLGVSPLQIHNTKKLDFAKSLILETNLPINEIAFTSGFNSLRRFNDAFLLRFKKPPTYFRKEIAEKTSMENSALTMNLPFRNPFDFNFILKYLKFRSVNSIEDVTDKYYSRSFILNGKTGYFKIKKHKVKNALQVELHYEDKKELLNIINRIKYMFDLNADPVTILNYLSKKPVLENFIDNFKGLRIPGFFDANELFIRTIVGQQISLKGAITILNRIVDKYGEVVKNSPYEKINKTFPTVEKLLKSDLTNLGLTNRRIDTIKDFCKYLIDFKVDLNKIYNLDKLEKDLLNIKGIGKWTVEYVKMRGLNEPNSFPNSDLVLAKCVNHYLNDFSSKTVNEKLTKHWEPWKSYAAFALWNQWGIITD